MQRCRRLAPWCVVCRRALLPACALPAGFGLCRLGAWECGLEMCKACKCCEWLYGMDLTSPLRHVLVFQFFARLQADPDLAYAIRLQQEELQRIGQQRGAAARGLGGPAGTGAAVGTLPERANVVGAPASVRRVPSGQQQLQHQRGGGPSGAPSAAAAQPGGRRQCHVSLTTLFLLAVTVAWITLFILSLTDNGWTLGACSGADVWAAGGARRGPRRTAAVLCMTSLLCTGVVRLRRHDCSPVSQATWPSTPGQAPIRSRCWLWGRSRRGW